jgi:hypothetical protein
MEPERIGASTVSELMSAMRSCFEIMLAPDCLNRLVQNPHLNELLTELRA